MKSDFPSFYPPTEDEFDLLWKQGWFIFDANVLLNLYRYSEQTRSDFLTVIAALSSRIWIPHQAAMEYQRHRLSTIDAELKKFEAIRRVASWKRLDDELAKFTDPKRPTIEPQKFLEAIKPHFDDFAEHIDALEKKQIRVDSRDAVRDALDQLLKDKIGKAFTQKQIAAFVTEGAERYAREVPPGYVDPKKKGVGEYEYDGRVYKREYGDLLLWKQILNWAAAHKILYVVLITDDRTSDWWEIVKAPGGPSKTIGPRPELGAEIRATAGVKLFYMYQPDRFLEWAQKSLHIRIDESSLQQAHDISEVQALKDASITFEEGSARDFDRGAVLFRAIVDGKDVVCMISDEALEDYFGAVGRGESGRRAFERNRKIIERVAEEAIRSGRFDKDNRIRITTEDFARQKPVAKIDLHIRCDVPKCDCEMIHEGALYPDGHYEVTETYDVCPMCGHKDETHYDIGPTE